MVQSRYMDADIAAADRMVAQNRDFFRERSFHLWTWGLLLAGLFGVMTIVRYGFIKPVDGLEGWLWLVTVLAGVVLSFLFERYRVLPPANILSRILRNLWVGVGVSIILVGFLGGSTLLVPSGAHCGALSTLVGLGFFLSASLTASRGLRILALLWWLGAAVQFFLNEHQALFLMFSLVLAGLLFPGLALYWTHRVRPTES